MSLSLQWKNKQPGGQSTEVIFTIYLTIVHSMWEEYGTVGRAQEKISGFGCGCNTPSLYLGQSLNPSHLTVLIHEVRGGTDDPKLPAANIYDSQILRTSS